MTIKNYLLIKTVLLSFSLHCLDNRNQLYSTSFLKNYATAHKALRKYGFQKITFKTSDHLTLHGLFLSRPHATCNVIICTGWFPGRKEGTATFYDLLPEYCNILLFDARGRGSSEGPFLRNVWRYGINEYKDIIAAISFVNKYNTLPIIIEGICSGAFNAMHALIKLEKNNKINHYNIKGLICDSAWASVTEIIDTAALANINLGIAMILKYFYSKRSYIKKSLPYKFLTYMAYYPCKIVYTFCMRPLVKRYEAVTNLFDKIDQIHLPLFFIHSYDDDHANIKNVIKLSQSANKSKHWWIKKSYHAKHHLIHRKLYKNRLAMFINSCIK